MTRSNDDSLWKPLADVLTALLMIIMLLAMLLMLLHFLPQNEDEPDDDRDDIAYVGDWNDDSSSGGQITSGGGEAQTIDDSNDDFRFEYEGDGKAAIHVTVVDGETREVIHQEGIKFRLYRGSNQNPESLATHYPTLIRYDIFETDKDGTFYLPEKLWLEWYTIRNTVAPSGYASGQMQSFNPEIDYEWENPYELVFLLEPQKRSEVFKVIDSSTQEGVRGGRYVIIANDAIKNSAGDIVANKGDVIDEVNANDDGIVTTIPLRINASYTIKMVDCPIGYARMEDQIITVDATERITEYPIQQTKVILKVQDELNGDGIRNVSVTLIDQNKKRRSFRTNEQGIVEITGFEKALQYVVKQETFATGYRENGKQDLIYIDADGLVDGTTPETDIVFNNRIIRASVKCRSKLFSNSNANPEISFNGRHVENGSELDGLEPGEYTIEVKGLFGVETYTKTIDDVAELQILNISAWSFVDILILTIPIIIVLTGAVIFLIIRKKKR